MEPTMNGKTAVQLKSSITTESTAEGMMTIVAGTKTFDRIIRHGKLIAAAHASVVERSSRAPAIQASSGRNIGKVRSARHHDRDRGQRAREAEKREEIARVPVVIEGKERVSAKNHG